MIRILLDLLTVTFLVFGLFFMAVAALGLLRMPDVYHRIHTTTKGVTLGISSLLIASVFSLAGHPDTEPVNIITRAVLVIVFQFVANPVGAHILSKAAHLDGAPQWRGTLGDEYTPPTDPAP